MFVYWTDQTVSSFSQQVDSSGDELSSRILQGEMLTAHYLRAKAPNTDQINI